MAQSLVTAREKGGPFRSSYNLAGRVDGLGITSIKRFPEFGILLSFEKAGPVRCGAMPVRAHWTVRASEKERRPAFRAPAFRFGALSRP